MKSDHNYYGFIILNFRVLVLLETRVLNCFLYNIIGTSVRILFLFF